ncbi:hypothetical protein KL912_000593 [Ogataea haglerorum]|nr:hypothetical protein KL912_000593 [Ogataea haglerorum]
MATRDRDATWRNLNFASIKNCHYESQIANGFGTGCRHKRGAPDRSHPQSATGRVHTENRAWRRRQDALHGEAVRHAGGVRLVRRARPATQVHARRWARDQGLGPGTHGHVCGRKTAAHNSTGTGVRQAWGRSRDSAGRHSGV